MQTLFMDLRHARRSLSRTPGFTGIALLCLALGIGATTAVFSVMQAVLLRPLPFFEPDRLVLVWTTLDAAESEGTQYFLSPRELMHLRETSTTFSGISGTRVSDMHFGSEDGPELVSGAEVTAELFAILGLQPILGRVFTADEDRAGASVVVISRGLWQRALGETPDVVGRDIRLNDQPYTVVGVLPDAPRHPTDVDVWLPLALEQTEEADLARGSLQALGRLSPGVSVARAQEDLALAAEEFLRRFPAGHGGIGFGTDGWHNQLTETTRPALFALLAAVAFLLAIAVGNVANLQLVRAQSVGRDVALRRALGASQIRLVRQQLVESLTLGAGGGVAGVAAAYAGLPILLRLYPDTLVPYGTIQLDTSVLAFAAVLAMSVACVFGLAPVLRSLRPDLNAVFKESGAGSGVGRGTRRVQQTLVVVEIAVALVLLVGAGLVLRSFQRVLTTDPGFTTDGVLTIRVAAPPDAAAQHESRVRFFGEVLDAVRSVPGVSSAGATHSLPLTDIIFGMGYNVEGQPPADVAQRHTGVYRLVTPGYIESIGMRLIEGRSFAETDRAGSPLVVIVSESLARTRWPNESPIGKRLKRGRYDAETPWRTVVGVAADVRDQGLDNVPQAGLFLPYTQLDRSYASTMMVVVQAEGTLATLIPSVRRAIQQVDAAALIHDAAPLADRVMTSLAQERFNSILLGLFAGLGLILAGTGIYGVVSYTIAQRRRELGLRTALGADAPRLMRMLLAWGVRMAALGLAIGLLGAAAMTQLLRSQLVGVSSLDPVTYAAVSVLVAGIALLATWLPARRAVGVDPVIALRID